MAIYVRRSPASAHHDDLQGFASRDNVVMWVEVRQIHLDVAAAASTVQRQYARLP